MALKFLLPGMCKQYLRAERLLTLCAHGGTVRLNVWSGLETPALGSGPGPMSLFHAAVLQQPWKHRSPHLPPPPPDLCVAGRDTIIECASSSWQ